MRVKSAEVNPRKYPRLCKWTFDTVVTFALLGILGAMIYSLAEVFADMVDNWNPGPMHSLAIVAIVAVGVIVFYIWRFLVGVFADWLVKTGFYRRLSREAMDAKMEKERKREDTHASNPR